MAVVEACLSTDLGVPKARRHVEVDGVGCTELLYFSALRIESSDETLRQSTRAA